MGEAFIVRRNIITSGGSGLSNTDAILTVTVPTGSTVTAAKGGVTLTPTMWVQAADATLDCALFVIPQSMFDAVNAWTVAASYNGSTTSNTVTISDNKQYDVKLGFFDYVIDGVLNQDVITTALLTTSVYRDDVPFYFRRSASSPNNNNGIVMGQVDLTNYKTFVLDASYQSSTNWNNGPHHFGFTESDLTYRSNTSGLAAYYEPSGNGNPFARQEMTIDVSNLTGPYYFRYCFWDGSNGRINIYNMYLRG